VEGVITAYTDVLDLGAVHVDHLRTLLVEHSVRSHGQNLADSDLSRVLSASLLLR